MLQIQKMSAAEKQIMKLIWIMKLPVTVSEVLKKSESDWGYTTMATFMQRLCEKGMLRVEKKGNTNLYYPELTEQEYLSFETISFIENVHKGSLKSFMAALCKEESELDISKEKIEELRRIIEAL